MSGLNLLVQRRFGPFFAVQFAGAFNDNLYKNAMVLMLSYRAATEAESGFILSMAGALFILPFFLFSPIAGQLADKYEKSLIIRLVKFAEIIIMLLGALAFLYGQMWFLMSVLFLMGAQSAFFGPVKFSILPQVLKEQELVSGNAWIEMGTFLAILLGTLAGGYLAYIKNLPVIGLCVIGVAVVGYLFARAVPPAVSAEPELKISWNFFGELKNLWRIAHQREGIWHAVLGVSWFWFFGATVLSLLPAYTKHVLIADETVVTLLLAIFSVSIGIGSLLTERLSRGDLELGLIPLGALGMAVFTLDLFWIDYPEVTTSLQGAKEFFVGAAGGQSWRVMMDLGMIGGFSSLFIVPMFAFLQSRSEEKTRSRLIAANNVFNALFMVVSALMTMLLYQMGLSTLEILVVTGILHIVVSVYVFLQVPEFCMRFVVWVLASTIYRLRYVNRDLIPRTGPVVLVANHISFIDWFILTAACRRPVHFVMYYKIFQIPILRQLFQLAKAIPIAGAKENESLKIAAFQNIDRTLSEGDVVGIFPEGAVSHDGQLAPFRTGVEQILATRAVPVVAVGIQGLWGSFFSRRGGKAMSKVPLPRRRLIVMNFALLSPEAATAANLEKIVKELVG